ncbi:MAG: DUF1887 family CARF protein [Methanothrix sp.]
MNNLRDFQSQHLFLLVGTNPLPNIVAAKLLRKPKGQVYFIHTDETLKIAQRLSDSLGLNETTRKFIQVEESNIADISNKVTDICKNLSDQEVGLNYTGGTKTMVVHSYRAIEKACREPVFSYLDARSMKMVVERRGQLCLDSSVSLSIKPKIQDLLALHGYILDEDPTWEPFQSDICRELARIPCNELRAWCDNNLRQERDRKKKNATQLKSVSLPVNPPFDKVAHHWQGCQLLGDLAKCWGIRVDKLADWMDGLWLEHYTLWALKQIAPRCQIHQSGLNIKPIEGEIHRGFELDVIAMRGYQLFALSCTTDLQKSRQKSKLFEAYIRARQMGGDEARVALVCCALKDKDDGSPDVIQNEIEETWDAKGKLRVFGAEHLPNLSAYLKDWFDSQPKMDGESEWKK